MRPDPLIEAVLKSGVTLPSPSPSIGRLQAAAASDRSGPRDLAAIASTDPVLVGLLTRIANTPVFPHHGPLRSLVDVIAMLGGTKTIAIAVGAALQGRAAGVDPKLADAIWARSVEVAGWALRIAHRLRLSRLADLAFMAGLVHDAGLCVMLRRYPAEAAGFRRAIAVDFDQGASALDLATGGDHAAIGCLVARNWKLPAPVAEAVRVHHAPALASSPPPEFADAAVIAACLAGARRIVAGSTPDWQAWGETAAALAGIDDALLDGLVAPG